MKRTYQKKIGIIINQITEALEQNALTWYTGSAGWMYKAGLEYILGFQKNGDTATLDPCITKKWPEYTIRYKYIDAIYNIKVKNLEEEKSWKETQ